jgi:hypothetical protein
MRREVYWMERFRSLTDRALAFGATDWTVDFQNQAKALLEEFRDEVGSFGACEVCREREFLKNARAGGSNPDVIKACAGCRHEDEDVPDEWIDAA